MCLDKANAAERRKTDYRAVTAGDFNTALAVRELVSRKSARIQRS